MIRAADTAFGENDSRRRASPYLGGEAGGWAPFRKGLLTVGAGACSGAGAPWAGPGWAVPAGGWAGLSCFSAAGLRESIFSRSTTEAAPFSRPVRIVSSRLIV